MREEKHSIYLLSLGNLVLVFSMSGKILRILRILVILRFVVLSYIELDILAYKQKSKTNKYIKEVCLLEFSSNGLEIIELCAFCILKQLLCP